MQQSREQDVLDFGFYQDQTWNESAADMAAVSNPLTC